MRLLRSSAVYTLGNAGQRLIQFLLLPLFTRAMSPDEYGHLGVALTVTLVLNLVFTFGADAAIIRLWFRLADDAERRDRALGTLGAFIVLVPTCLAVPACVLLLVLDPTDPAPGGLLALATVNAALYPASTSFPQAILRAQERLKGYAVLAATTTVGTSVLTIVFVLGLDWGAEGWLWAVLLGQLATAVAAALVLPWPRPRWDPGELRAALALGLPLIPNQVSLWLLQFSDRAVLATLVSTAAVGVFTLAGNVAVPLSIVVVAISQALQPAYGAAAHDEVARRRLPTLVNAQVLAVVLSTAGVMLFGPLMIDVFVPDEYGEAISLMPWIAAAFGLWGLYFIPMNAITFLAGRTTWVWTLTLAISIVKVALLVVIVPATGIKGAAVSLTVAMAALVFAVSLYAWRIAEARVGYDWLFLSGLIAAGTAVVVPVTAFASSSDLLGTGFRAAGLAVLAATFAAMWVRRAGGLTALSDLPRQD